MGSNDELDARIGLVADIYRRRDRERERERPPCARWDSEIGATVTVTVLQHLCIEYCKKVKPSKSVIFLPAALPRATPPWTIPTCLQGSDCPAARATLPLTMLPPPLPPLLPPPPLPPMLPPPPPPRPPLPRARLRPRVAGRRRTRRRRLAMGAATRGSASHGHAAPAHSAPDAQRSTACHL